MANIRTPSQQTFRQPFRAKRTDTATRPDRGPGSGYRFKIETRPSIENVPQKHENVLNSRAFKIVLKYRCEKCNNYLKNIIAQLQVTRMRQCAISTRSSRHCTRYVRAQWSFRVFSSTT